MSGYPNVSIPLADAFRSDRSSTDGHCTSSTPCRPSMMPVPNHAAAHRERTKAQPARVPSPPLRLRLARRTPSHRASGRHLARITRALARVGSAGRLRYMAPIWAYATHAGATQAAKAGGADVAPLRGAKASRPKRLTPPGLVGPGAGTSLNSISYWVCEYHSILVTSTAPLVLIWAVTSVAGSLQCCR